MREIIKHHKIELVARNADDRRCPEVAKRCGPLRKKNYEKEDGHDSPVDTHGTNAHRESEDTECQNYD
jgi:hypothetical protein